MLKHNNIVRTHLDEILFKHGMQKKEFFKPIGYSYFKNYFDLTAGRINASPKLLSVLSKVADRACELFPEDWSYSYDPLSLLDPPDVPIRTSNNREDRVFTVNLYKLLLLANKTNGNELSLKIGKHKNYLSNMAHDKPDNLQTREIADVLGWHGNVTWLTKDVVIRIVGPTPEEDE